MLQVPEQFLIRKTVRRAKCAAEGISLLYCGNSTNSKRARIEGEKVNTTTVMVKGGMVWCRECARWSSLFISRLH